MSAFPTRTSADAIGPPMREDLPGKLDERRHASPRRMNLLRWIAAGASQTVNRAWCYCKFTGPSTIAIPTGSSGSAWQGAAPGVARTAQGIYVVTFAATYADELGNLVAPDLIAAAVHPEAHTPKLRGDWSIASGRIVTINLFDKTDALTDGSFLLSVF